MSDNKLNLANLRTKLKELKEGNKGISLDVQKKFALIPEYDMEHPDRSVIRILPAGDTNENFFSETSLHRIGMQNIHCPKFKGDPCPVCQYISELWNTKDQENIDRARQIKARKRYYFNVIVRERVITDEKTGKDVVEKDAGPLIFSCGVKLFEKFLKTILDDEEYGDITDLRNGWDFRIIKEIKDGYPNYDDSKPKRDPSPAGTKEQMAQWMGELHNLSELIKYKTTDELIKELQTYRSSFENTDDSFNNAVFGNTDSNENNSTPQNVENNEEEKNNEDGEGITDDFMEELRRMREE